MRPEDLGRFMEEAFAKIEPKDEAQREKLARMRAKIGEANAEMAQALTKAREEMADRKAGHEETKRIAQERGRIGQETREALLAAFDEQADLIERIVDLRKP